MLWCSGSTDVFAGGIRYLCGVSSAKKQLDFFQLTPERQAFDFVQGSLQDPWSLKNFYYLWLNFVSLYFSGDCSPGPRQDPSVWAQHFGAQPSLQEGSGTTVLELWHGVNNPGKCKAPSISHFHNIKNSKGIFLRTLKYVWESCNSPAQKLQVLRI